MSNFMLESALSYIADDFKVFPVKPDKKPLTAHGLTDATVISNIAEEYWRKWPDAGIGLVTDGLIVLDFDKKNGGLKSKEDIENKYGGLPPTRIHRTGGGGFHYIYRNPDGKNVRCTVNFGGYHGVDLRANGGYIVVPPSLHENGTRYEVINESSIAMSPQWIIELATGKFNNPQTIQNHLPILPGERNTTLTSFAGAMRRRGMTQTAIEAALIQENKRCRPPLTDKEVLKIAGSICRYPVPMEFPIDNNSSIICPSGSSVALERDKSVTESVTKSLTKRIEKWVSETNGWFSYEECDRELGIQSINDKNNRRQVFKRLKEDGKMESHPENNKLFRYKKVAVRLIDFKSASNRTPLNIKYPFAIEQFFNTYPGNIIALAGAADAGKTAYLLNFVKLNQFDFSIYYQSSEMGREEMANRLSNFEGISLDEWNFIAEERSCNFSDVIRPDCINIIDYMELSNDFYKVADYMRQIHDKLAGGVCIVALQKKRGAILGRGGDFGLEKPRLYLSMDAGELSIQKAKNWVDPSKNPNGLSIKFKLIGGCKFVVTEDWHKD